MERGCNTITKFCHLIGVVSSNINSNICSINRGLNLNFSVYRFTSATVPLQLLPLLMTIHFSDWRLLLYYYTGCFINLAAILGSITGVIFKGERLYQCIQNHSTQVRHTIPTYINHHITFNIIMFSLKRWSSKTKFQHLYLFCWTFQTY